MKLGKPVDLPEIGEKHPSTLPCAYSNKETVPVQKVSDKFYMDETVRECELPELTVCYKESIENDIKDICVDEGVPCKDKVFFETLEDESETKIVCSHLVKEQRSELAQGVEDTSVCSPDGRKSLDNSELDKNSDEQCNSKYSMQSGNAEDCAEDEFKEITNPFIVTSEQAGIARNCSTDKIEYDNIKETTSPVNVNMSAKVSESNSGNEDSDQCHQIPNVEAKLGSFASVSKSEGPGNLGEETSVATYQSCAKAESDPTSPSNELVYNQAAANGSSISNCDSSAAAEKSGGERPKNDLRELLEIENASRIEGGHSDRWLVPNRVRNGNGETSFSVNGAISGRISYSGSLPYSGSVSMRSDSSTTSARSFAFPVIQSEWNSSPVRMARADRRHLRKHRRWKDAILCCRF